MEQHLKDITAPKGVEVSIRDDGKVLWINVDGKCELRACQIGNLTINDQRKPPWRPRPVKWETEAIRLKDINVMFVLALENILARLEKATSAQKIDDRNYIMDVIRNAIKAGEDS